jgi:hypothetical protein
MIFEAQDKKDVLETIKNWIEEKEEGEELDIKIEDYIVGGYQMYALTISKDASYTEGKQDGTN